MMRTLAKRGIYVRDIWDRISGDVRYVNINLLYLIYRTGFVVTAEARAMKARLDVWYRLGFGWFQS